MADIAGVDLLPVDPLPPAHILQMDFTDPACGLYESLGVRRHATLVGYSRSSRSSSSAESNADSS